MSFMSMQGDILTIALEHGYQTDYLDDSFPSKVTAWSGGSLSLNNDATHFGFVQNGSAHLSCQSGTFTMSAGMYFAAPGECAIRGSGAGIVVSRRLYLGVFHLGGPIEEHGRLRYIDGCTDSLLIPPVVKGDPCLNLLQIPAQTNQTEHTHPSLRIGLVVNGGGECRNPRSTSPLSPGILFVIPAGALHSFHTDDSELTIIAYHPDSDFGPTHEVHPMLNRTLVGGHPISHGDCHEVS